MTHRKVSTLSPLLQKKPPPLRRLEISLHARGFLKVAGLDEAGRGCLAGPVFAAAVIFPTDLVWKTPLKDVDDSKKLSPEKRESLFDVICGHALAWSVAQVDNEDIDRINIHHASLLAMTKASESLCVPPDYLLIDGKFPVPHRTTPQEAVIDGDALCFSIAAASILAKVSRDRWMVAESRKYPEYSLDRHKGYATPQHREAIRRHGPTPIHRKSFRWF